MTSSINTFNFPKDMNLTIIKNSSKLSSYEQKNLAILILVRYKLAFFVKQNPNDEFINKLYAWLDVRILFYETKSRYFLNSEKNHFISLILLIIYGLILLITVG